MMTCGPFSDGGSSDDDVRKLLYTARHKFDKPSPEQPDEIDPDTGEVKDKPKMFYVTGDKVEFNCETNDFVQGLLGRGALSVVYGESNCGKTFFMTDLAFHIAEGKKK